MCGGGGGLWLKLDIKLAPSLMLARDDDGVRNRWGGREREREIDR